MIIHIDMDCFYAAIEVREHPELKGEPVAVGGRSRRRGVLTTCNYEARKFGIHSAMPTFQAVQRCPHLVVLPVRPDLYRRESKRVRAILSEYTDLIEPLSLDEAFLDVSDSDRHAVEIAREIRKRIRQTTGLTASAGIAPNKMLAKIASDWKKPNGQFALSEAEIAPFMQDLPVSKIWGVGKRAAEKLRQNGIETCGQLQGLQRFEIQRLFGKFGGDLYELCRGIDHRPVRPNRIRKSMSAERTFAQNIESLEDCQQSAADIFDDLCHDFARLKAERPIAKIFVKFKYADFSRTSIERTGAPFTLDSYQDLISALYQRTGAPVRLIGLGIRFSDIRATKSQQLLFDFT